MANGFCYRHNPEISDADKKKASASGGRPTLERVEQQLKAVPNFELSNNPQSLLDLLVNNINDLRAGKIDPKTSNAVVQNVGMILRVYETVIQESRIRELEKLQGIQSPPSITTTGDN
jgi:hypothetical protein